MRKKTKSKKIEEYLLKMLKEGRSERATVISKKIGQSTTLINVVKRQMGIGYESGIKERVLEYAKKNPKINISETARRTGISQPYCSQILSAAGIKKIKIGPKILLFDLETSPMETYLWSLKSDYVSPDFIIKRSAILSWSAKWLFDSEIMGEAVKPAEAKARTDKRIVKSLWKLLDEADIVIAHNLKGFDRKIAQTRFLMNGLRPPKRYQMVDTLLHIRKEFRFASNKLDYVSQILNNNQKIETSMKLWKQCVSNKKESQEALDRMLKYNKQDIILLETLYLKIRGWIKGHPNVAIYEEDIGTACPNCSSKKLKKAGKYYTATGRYQSLQCSDCGAFGRRRYSDLTAAQRINLLAPQGS